MERRTKTTDGASSRDPHGRTEVQRLRLRLPRRTTPTNRDGSGMAQRAAPAELHRLQDRLARRTTRADRHGSRDAYGRAEVQRVHSRVARGAAPADRHGPAYSGRTAAAELHRLPHELARRATRADGAGSRDAHGRAKIHRVHPGMA